MQLAPLSIGAIAALLGLIALFFTYFGGAWLRVKIGDAKLQLVRGYAEEAVAYIEQLWRSGQIQKDSRFQAAVDYLMAQCPWLTEEQLEVFVNAALARLKIDLGEWDKQLAGDILDGIQNSMNGKLN